MLLGFVHFDRADQKKYLEVLSRITEGGAIDELGLGRLRDYFSDTMFPGISSLHQHAKYFVLMPLIYWDAVAQSFSRPSDVRAWIRREEYKDMERLCEYSPEGTHGITGSDSKGRGVRHFVKYDPMYIYGTALYTYGITKTENIEAAILHVSKMLKEKAVKVSASGDEQGDSDDREHLLRFCARPSNLEYDKTKECSITLTPNDAAFIKGHMLSAPKCKGTLLHFILEKELDLGADDVETFAGFIKKYRSILPPELAEQVSRADAFSDLVDGLYYRYNMLYSGYDSAHGKEGDTAMKKSFDDWYETVFLPRWQDMAESFKDARINDPDGSKGFCGEAIHLMVDKQWTKLDTLITQRERKIKVTRSKIGSADQPYNPKRPIHNYKQEFRWATVRTLISEIQNPEKK